MFLAVSKADRLRINNPWVAAMVVETATTNGTAKPSAWGHVITITVTVRSSAKAKV